MAKNAYNVIVCRVLTKCLNALKMEGLQMWSLWILKHWEFQIIIGCILIDIWHKATTLKVLLALMRGGTLYGRCKSKRMSGSANTWRVLGGIRKDSYQNDEWRIIELPKIEWLVLKQILSENSESAFFFIPLIFPIKRILPSFCRIIKYNWKVI